MTWLFTLLAMAVIALVAGVVTGRISGSMGPADSSLPFRGLPPGDVDAADLESLRFDAALRGYRMSEVDEVLDRLGDELRRRDAEIAELREALAGPPMGLPTGAAALADADADIDSDVSAGDLDGYAPVGGAVRSPYDSPYDPAYAPPSGGFDLPDRPDVDRGQG